MTLFETEPVVFEAITEIPLEECDLLTQHANELAKCGPSWRWYQWEALPGHPQEATLHKLVGAVAPLKKKPQGRADYDYKRMDKSTKREIYITFVDHEAWCKAWSERTGKCSECRGVGERFAGWHHERGVDTRVCDTCKGTGKP
jgi:hypothetical protein